MVNESKLFIKGMVCQRCISIIEELLKNAGLQVIKISLGEVTVVRLNRDFDTASLSQKLSSLGFTLLEDKKISVVSHVKQLVAEIYSGNFDFPEKFRFSDIVSQKLHKDYDTVSALFSLVEQKTIERFILDHKIEKVKELLVYTSLTLSDIALKLHYSSVAHLSRQFKQLTGLTPSHFKEIQRSKAGYSSAVIW